MHVPARRQPVSAFLRLLTAVVVAAGALAPAPARAASPGQELERLQKDIERIGAEHTRQQQALRQVNVNLDQTAKRLDATRKRIDENKARLAEQATDLYVHGSTYFDEGFTRFVGMRRAGDFAVASAYLNTLQSRAAETLGRLRADNEDLTAAKAQLEAEQKRRKQIIADLEAEQERAEAAVSQQQAIVDRYRAQLSARQIASVAPRSSPPGNVRGYGNGRLPDSALESLGIGDHRLVPGAAQAFKRIYAAASAAGVHIGITDSYRSYPAQVSIARRKGLYGRGGLAAVPGTSNHGWGLSLDLGLDSSALRWMRANARRYGFYEDVPRENWHWTYKGG